MIDAPDTPTWTVPNAPTRRTTQAEDEAAARMARRHARSIEEADLFLHQLGLEGR